MTSTRPVLLYLNSDCMGRGDDELGRKLMKSFLSTILAAEKKVDRIICVNSAIFLTTEGSPVIEELSDFERQGTETGPFPPAHNAHLHSSFLVLDRFKYSAGDQNDNVHRRGFLKKSPFYSHPTHMDQTRFISQ